MAIRVHEPSRLATGEAGRVHLTRYPDSITLELASRAQDDYVEFANAKGGPTPLLMVVEKPLPLPGMDVRSHWRETAKQEPGFEGIALVIGGVVGLMAATVTHFGEQLVAVLGVRFRTFTSPFDAADWLCETFSCEATPDELAEVVRMLRTIDER